MPERSPAPAGGVFTSPGPAPRLESWKAIAEYLGRHVTTVQRWEQDEGLPVHRHQHEKRGSVYAYAAELDAWLQARSVEATPVAPPSVQEARSRFEARTPVAEAADAPAVDLDASAAVDPSPAEGQAGASGGSPPDEARAAAGRATRRWAAAGVVLAASLALAIVGGLGNTLWPARRSDGTKSVAVLPLTNRSPDQQPDYFVDGMTEALMTDLASLSGIRVIAHQSAMQYRDSGKPASTIAAELDVDALVEGAVQRSGRRVRVDIRLIDGSTSRALWAATYERDVGDALALQSDISREIVGELHVTLDPSQRTPVANRRPSDPEAWDAYLRARFFWNKRTHEDMERAVAWYERALRRDPSSAMIYAGLADVYASLGPPKMAVSELIARGTTAAETAIRLDPSMGEPLAAVGKLRAYAWDWQGAELNYRKAIVRAPGYAPARYWFGSFLANQGRCDEALAEGREAERLDPISLPGNMVVSAIELRCNRVGEAIGRSRMILEFDPNYAASYEYLGRAYLLQGKVDDAIAALGRAVDLTGGRATVLATQAYAYAAAGRKREAEALAAELAARHNRDKVLASAWSLAIAHAGLRDDAAIEWLEHAYADREEWLEGLAADERFRHLRGDGRFQRLLDRLGLPSERPRTLTRW